MWWIYHLQWIRSPTLTPRFERRSTQSIHRLYSYCLKSYTEYRVWFHSETLFSTTFEMLYPLWILYVPWPQLERTVSIFAETAHTELLSLLFQRFFAIAKTLVHSEFQFRGPFMDKTPCFWRYMKTVHTKNFVFAHSAQLYKRYISTDSDFQYTQGLGKEQCCIPTMVFLLREVDFRNINGWARRILLQMFFQF